MANNRQMPPEFKKIACFSIIFSFLFNQLCFSQITPQLFPLYFAQPGFLSADKFRPLHLRYLELDRQTQGFQIFLDKGDAKYPDQASLAGATKELMDYFRIGLALSNSSFWVNLRPDQKDNIIDPFLEKTDIGKILLEADMNLKKDLANATSPGTKEGKQYWDKIYIKAGELFGEQRLSLPTFTRPWIVPGEIIIRQTPVSAYIYKATLKVMLEQDYLKNAAPAFEDERMKQLNDYSSELIRTMIIPSLTLTVNSSKRYASLRQVYYSLILSQWFKMKYVKAPDNENPGLSAAGLLQTDAALLPYVRLINSNDLRGLSSKKPWSKTTYFNQYRRSFQKGEYDESETITTPYGQTIRQYTSGGITFATLPALMLSGLANVISTHKPLSPGLNLAAVSIGADGVAHSPGLASKSEKVIPRDGGALLDPGKSNLTDNPLSAESLNGQERLAKDFFLNRPEIMGKLKPFDPLLGQGGYSSFLKLYETLGGFGDLFFENILVLFKPLINTQEDVVKITADLDKLMRLPGEEEKKLNYLFRLALPALLNAFTPEELPVYWDSFIAVSIASEDRAGELLMHGIPALRNKFGVENFARRWPEFYRLGMEEGRYAVHFFEAAMTVDEAAEQAAAVSLRFAQQISDTGINNIIMSGGSTILPYKLFKAAWRKKFPRAAEVKIYTFNGEENARLKKKETRNELFDTIAREIDPPGLRLMYVDTHWRSGLKRVLLKAESKRKELNIKFAVFSAPAFKEFENDIIGSPDPVFRALIYGIADDVSFSIKSDKRLLRTRLNDSNAEAFEARLPEGIKIYLDAIMRAIEASSDTAARQVPAQDGGMNNPGGIDFRDLRIVNQPLPAVRPNSAAPAQPKIPLSDLDKEWNKIEESVNKGYIPSGETIKEYILSCFQKPDINRDIEKALGCISNILRLEEDYALYCEPGFIELLNLLESDKSAQELKVALSSVSFK